MSISFGHGLDLTSFRVQKKTASGNWSYVSTVRKGFKYRFKVQFKNTNSGSSMPPFTDPHSHLETYSVELTNTGLARFYSSSSFTGSSSTRGVDHGYHKIFHGKSKTFYFYFKWNSPNDIQMPLPGAKILVGLWSAVSKGKPTKTLVPFI